MDRIFKGVLIDGVVYIYDHEEVTFLCSDEKNRWALACYCPDDETGEAYAEDCYWSDRTLDRVPADKRVDIEAETLDDARDYLASNWILS